MRRWQRITQWTILALATITICGAFTYWLTSQPRFGRTAVQTQPITWSALPSPTLQYPQWQSFTNSNSVNALLQVDGFLWIGTDGGLLVQSLSNGDIVTFKSEHGLASNRVTALALGLDRSIWVGTTGGVSRYDGLNWQTFTANDALSDNWVNDITIAGDGALWVATPQGLDRYNGNRWVNYNALNTAFGLRSQTVRHVVAVPNSDQIWAATDRGLIFFDGRRWENVTFGDSELGSDNVLALDITADGTLWIGHQAGLQRVQNGRWERYAQIDGLLEPEVHWLQAISSNEVWLGYRDGIEAISQLRIESGGPSLTHLDTAVHFDQNVVQALLPIGSSTLIGSGDGLYEEENGRWQHQPLPADVPTHEVNSLIGALGTVWSGGTFGVGRFDGSGWQFFTEEDGLINQSVNMLALGPNQTPYAVYGVAGMGLSAFQPNGRWETIPCPINAPHSLLIYDGVRDQAGGYWFGMDRGVAHFDQTVWQIYTPFHGLPEGRIWDVETAPDGTIWTAGEGGFAFLQNNRWNIIQAEEAQQVTVAPNGTVWGLTIDEVVQIRNGILTPISSIAAPYIGTIDATSDALWVATVDGVARLDANSLSWRSYTAGEGLPFNRTPVIWVDEAEQVWAVSESGPQDPANGYFIPYSFNHRYVSKLVDDFWQPTLISDQSQPLHGISTDIALAPDGTIWAGTLAGVSHFDGEIWRSYTMANGLLAPEVYGVTYGFDGIWVATQNGVVQLVPHGALGMVATNRLGWSGDAFLRLKLQTAPDGTVWASNGRTLYQFNGTAWQSFEVDQSLGNARLDSFAFDDDGRLWGTLSLQGDIPLDTDRTYLGVRSEDGWQWQPIHSLSQPQPNSLNTLTFAPDGRLWGGSTNGVWIFDTTQPDYGNTVYGFRNPVEQVTDITFRADGTALITSRFKNELFTISDNAIEQLPLPIFEASGAHAAVVDPSGDAWIGTNQGLVQLVDSDWRTYEAPAFQVEGTSTWLTVEEDNKFWLGSAQGQVIAYEDGTVKQLPLFTDPRSIERPFVITAVFPEGDSELTISSILGGAARFDGQQWQRYGSSASLYDGLVQAIAFQDETAWLGTSDGVVTRNVFSNEACQLAENLDWEDTQLILTDANDTVWFLGGQVVYWLDEERIGRGGYQALPVGTAGRDGSVWFATINGLMRHGDGRSRELITDLPTESDINTLTTDANGVLWMGTADGVFTFDRREWQRITSQTGLADNVITQITFAPDGAIWFVTAGGLSRYQP